MREPHADATASAVLSAATTGLTTGTPTRSLKSSQMPGRKAMLMQPSTEHVGPVLLHGDAGRLGGLVERARASAWRGP